MTRSSVTSSIILSSSMPSPPTPTLFPYTTLFRSKARWQVHAYCLMGNHFHLVLETPLANLVAGMKWFLRSEEHTSELQSRGHLVCRLLLEKKKNTDYT